MGIVELPYMGTAFVNLTSWILTKTLTPIQTVHSPHHVPPDEQLDHQNN